MLVSRRLTLIGLALSAALPGHALAQTRGDGRRRRTASEAPAVAPAHTFAFGPDPLQAYDLYADGGTGPILMFVHGGGWSRGERTMVAALPDYARRHGLTLASTSYRLAPAVSARESALDVAAAVADLKHRLPGRPIYLLGHSAGAHLAALVGVDPDYLGAVGLKPSDLAGVILLDGAGYDATAPRADGPIDQWLGRTYDQAFGDQAAALSPLLRIRPGAAYPPFLIFHVARRQDSAAQSRALAEALIRAGGHAEVVPAPNDSHMTIKRDFGVAGDPEGERAARFILG
ncbi:MAG: esterase [Brevundimonas sp.]|uniref:alpha/beta hydrolase n=1 Tax=Brevundimonas sp. TaxID=1871086 RepID=UPI000DB0BD4C|nr:alpha/beta hydrolase [Brevundimonas sp.]PZU76554.1 MAG: esterase [Brevundimonas sp.]